MADLTKVRSEYVAGMQHAASLVLQLNNALDNLSALYQGAGLSGTFLDAELLEDVTSKHLAAADIGTFTANLNTIRSAVTTNITQNMSKAVGKPV